MQGVQIDQQQLKSDFYEALFQYVILLISLQMFELS